MILPTFAILGLLTSASAITIPKPFKPPQVRPRPPQQPDIPQRPNNYKPPAANPVPAQAQAQINNVYGLNNRLKQIEKIEDYLDAGVDIASAILGTAQSTTVALPPKTIGSPTEFASAFIPCKRYASILASCATATASFYDLDYEGQASCVCYQPSTNTAACQAVPTLDLSYDVHEYMCYEFLSSMQATWVTMAMDEATVLPGPALCNLAVSQSLFTLPPALPPTTIKCATPTAPAAQSSPQGGEAVRLLTTSDRNILAMLSLLFVAFSGLLFL